MKFDTGIVKNGMAAASTFIKETRSEANKVIWPDQRYVLAATVIILIIVFLTGGFVMSIDYVFGKMFAYLMNVH